MSKQIILAQKPFLSVQGEGKRTGVLTIFVRFAGCNLRCPGFFQEHPTQPETYKPALDVSIFSNPKLIQTLNDFPVPKYGCDTLYAIDPKFKHLWTRYQNVDDLIKEIESLLPKKDDQHTWVHPDTGNGYDICFTGGEPLLHQVAIESILEAQYKRSSKLESYPDCIQFETNGTQEVEESLNLTLDAFNVLFNVSPKLFAVTGEPTEKTWFPDKILNLFYSGNVSVKFVVNDTIEAFDELDVKVKELVEHPEMGYFGIFVMPVGSSYEQQTDYGTINRISTMAVERGYQISGRLHCILFGNEHER